MKDFFILKGGGVELTGAPETITVLPLGHVVSSKGEFDVDEGSFQAMKAQIWWWTMSTRPSRGSSPPPLAG